MNGEDYNINYNFNKIIYDNNNIILSPTNNIFNNIKILNILNSDYYNSSKIIPNIDLLNSLDIKSIDNKFYEEWKEIKWKNIFKCIYNDFIDKITELINDIADFHILFNLLNINISDSKKRFDDYSLLIMQKKLIELLEKNNNKDISNYIGIIVLLIVYSEEEKIDMEDFLARQLRGILDVKVLSKIYKKILELYKNNICEKSRNIMLDVFKYNINDLEYDVLLYIIFNYPELSENCLKVIVKYNIKKEDFFSLNETENYKLFKSLLDKNFIQKKEYESIPYFQNSISIIKQLQKEIKDEEILFKDINRFFIKKKIQNNDEDEIIDINKSKIITLLINEGEKILLSRLNTIYLNKKEEAEQSKEMINKNYYEIKTIINNLQIILRDLQEFLPIKEKENIEILKNMIKDLLNGELNCYKINYKEKSNKIIGEYLKPAEERIIMKKSQFFVNIFKNNKKLYKGNDIKCLEETEKNFDKIKNIFNRENIKSLDKDILQILLNVLKGKSRKEISEEIDVLEKIFGRFFICVRTRPQNIYKLL